MNDKMKGGGNMHERTTNLHQPEKGKKNHPSAEASNHSRNGKPRQWVEVAQKYQVHPQTSTAGEKPWNKELKYSSAARSPKSTPHQETGNGKPKA